jgi:hypothetical protein
MTKTSSGKKRRRVSGQNIATPIGVPTLPQTANLAVFANIFHWLSLIHMKNKYKHGNGFGTLQEKQIRKLVLKPLTQLIMKRTMVLETSSQKCSRKIKKVEQMVEMIARQLARDLMEHK